MFIENLNSNSPFDETFCAHLEFHLSRTFSQSSRPDIKGYWCDGVLHIPIPEEQLTRKSVNDTRVIRTKAWIGKDGQGEYEMKIHFGSLSLKHYAKGITLIDCLPTEKTMDWITIDTERRTVDIHLK
jgi:hypothetical protein